VSVVSVLPIPCNGIAVVAIGTTAAHLLYVMLLHPGETRVDRGVAFVSSAMMLAVTATGTLSSLPAAAYESAMLAMSVWSYVQLAIGVAVWIHKSVCRRREDAAAAAGSLAQALLVVPSSAVVDAAASSNPSGGVGGGGAPAVASAPAASSWPDAASSAAAARRAAVAADGHSLSPRRRDNPLDVDGRHRGGN
jgi:hypothetical protein